MKAGIIGAGFIGRAVAAHAAAERGGELPHGSWRG
jgi:3-hydroxyacyl-CoA dehydrogenase